MIKRALIVGGAHGLGLDLAKELSSRDTVEIVYVVDIDYVAEADLNDKIMSFQFDLKAERYAFFDRFSDVDALIFTAALKEKAPFQEIPYTSIINAFNVNTIPALRLIDKFYDKIASDEDFYCAVNISSLGFMPVPMFSVYGATKAALKSFIETVNTELRNASKKNRIMGIVSVATETSPEVDKANDIKGILSQMERKWELYFPLAD